MIIDTDNFNIFEDLEKLEEIANKISRRFIKYKIKVNKKYLRSNN